MMECPNCGKFIPHGTVCTNCVFRKESVRKQHWHDYKLVFSLEKGEWAFIEFGEGVVRDWLKDRRYILICGEIRGRYTSAPHFRGESVYTLDSDLGRKLWDSNKDVIRKSIAIYRKAFELLDDMVVTSLLTSKDIKRIKKGRKIRMNLK